MQIVAMCPYCRAGGVRAPEHLIGVSATCPKCGSNFTVMPSSGVHGWGNPREDGPAAETRTHAASADVTEPSPVVRPDPARPKTRTPATAPPAAPSELALPLVALTLFGPAVLATQLPAGRWVALGVALVGGLLAFLALGSEGRARLVAAGGVLLHLAAAVLVLAAPGVFGLDPWRKPRVAATDTTPRSQGHITGLTAPAEWVDAATASWRAGDVRVTVRSAVLGPVELVGAGGAKRATKEQVLLIAVRVANEGPEHPFEVTDWATGGATLTDRATTYKPKRFEAGWEIPGRGRGPTAVYPSKWVDAVLAFDPPGGRTNGLKLELTGAAVGLPDPVRFTIPDDFIKFRKSDNRP